MHDRAYGPSPIAVFAYRRPTHLKNALAALKACPEFAASPVFIYIDGPKSSAVWEAVDETAQVAMGFAARNVTIVRQDANRGLATSIITEVTALCARYGRVIVMEDDLIVHPATLTWLNMGLDAYADDPRVMQISAYQYLVPEFESRIEGTFQRFTTTWGWATWKRAWDQFDASATGWEAVAEPGPAQTALDAGGVYPFSSMLLKQMNGQLDSWGIRWFWSVHNAGGLAIMPPRTLVRNDGIATAATHNSIGPLKAWVQGRPPKPWEKEGAPILPDEVALVPTDEAAFRRGLLRTHAMRNHRVKKVLAGVGWKRFA
ncbi:hypothetical protein [Phenylobacterium sp.]|uniref:hypothetical protein n=1 Tax=Phenylobacterium sp. TaxID=1871053 RepID=UPI0027321C32|nr:hypothetical protein [Phenylobacterium sp.]MDP1875927.1 hypothetical protein [Phenylobacterium sp.]